MVPQLNVQKFEEMVSNLPQAHIPMRHYFAGGIYAREMTLSAGVSVVGAVHRTEHLCTISQGRLLVSDGENSKEMSAPHTFVSKPGTQRVGYGLETTVWTTYHNVGGETDLDKIMAEICGMTNAELGAGPENKQVLRNTQFDADRRDYVKFLEEYGLTAEVVERIAQNQTDRAEVPIPGVEVCLSGIHGRGLVASYGFRAGEEIGRARLNGYRTLLGYCVNHSCKPNVIGVVRGDEIHVVALRDIAAGEELTTDYRQSMAINGSGLKPLERITK